MAALRDSVVSLDVEGVRENLKGLGNEDRTSMIQLLLGMGQQGAKSLEILELLLENATHLLREDGLFELVLKENQNPAIKLLLQKGCSPSHHDLCMAMKLQAPMETLKLMLEFRFEVRNPSYKALALSNEWKSHMRSARDFLTRVAKHVQYEHKEKLLAFFDSLERDLEENSKLQCKMYKDFKEAQKELIAVPLLYNPKKRKADSDLIRFNKQTSRWLMDRIVFQEGNIKSDQGWLAVHQKYAEKTVCDFNFPEFRDAMLACGKWQVQIDGMVEEVVQIKQELSKRLESKKMTIQDLKDAVEEYNEIAAALGQ